MPKYHYRCESCTRDWWEWNSITESDIEECPTCLKDSVVKVPTNFITINQTVGTKDKKVGEATKEGIEENREILKKMQKEATTKDFKIDD